MLYSVLEIHALWQQQYYDNLNLCQLSNYYLCI
jgi:hypothetical protein